MANECYFKMQVKGTFDAVQKFYNGLVHNGPIWIGRGIYHTTEQDPNDLMVSFKDFKDTNTAIIEGIIKWSLETSLVDFNKKILSKEIFNQDPNRKYYSLFKACKKLNVNIEAYSREELIGFEEHIKYENGNTIVDYTDFKAFYDEDNHIIKTEGGYGDWNFNLKMPLEMSDENTIEWHSMINKKSWMEFKDTGLLWYINSILQVFGWSIFVENPDPENKDTDKFIAYPSRVTFRGFDSDTNYEGYLNVTEYLQANIKKLLNEAEDRKEG